MTNFKWRGGEAALFFILIVLFGAAEYAAPRLFDYLFHNGGSAWLARVTHAAVNQPLEFYAARIHELYTGPFAMVCSGLALVLISLKVCGENTGRKFWLIIFLYLILTRIDVLFYPPYGDAIAGPFAEAVWLKDNHFDFAGLAAQPKYIDGGPKVYLFSIYPASLSLLMKIIPNVTAFLIINHLLAFAMAAVMVLYVRKTIVQITGCCTATLTALLLLALPLFQAQAEAINMEIPMTMFAVLAVYHLSVKDLGRASLFAALALSVKVVAIFVGFAVALTAILIFFFDEKLRGRWKILIGPALVLVLSLAQFYASFYITSDKQGTDMVGILQGWHHLKLHWATYVFPLAVLLWIIYIFRERFIDREQWSYIWKQHYIGWIFFVMTAGWFALFANSLAGFPRYYLLLMPFIILFLMFIVMLWLKVPRRVINAGILIFIITNLSAAYGYFQRPQEDKDHIQDHVMLERSLEYRNDIALRMQSARRIEKQYGDYTIGAPFLIAQILAMPELGYVHKKRDVVIYGFPCTYGGIRPFSGLAGMDLGHTIWVGVKQDLPPHMEFSDTYPVSRHDKVVEEITVGKRSLTLFMGGVAIEKMRLVSRAFLQYLAEQGRLKNPHEHNFGLDK